MNNCSCCLIKPHIIQNRQLGQVLDAILDEGFEVSALELFYLDKPTAEEFFELYKGVFADFSSMIEHVSSGGPSVVLEVRQENAVHNFRKLCGPHDPAEARHKSPNSLRATFGVDWVMNGVHCTDLPDDGVLESEYFFSILQNS